GGSAARVYLYAEELSGGVCQRVHLLDFHELADFCVRVRRAGIYSRNLARLAYRTHQYSSARNLRSRRRRAVDSSRRIGVHCLDFSFESEVWLSQCLADESFRPKVAAV